MLSVSGRSESVNERIHTDEKIPYSTGLLEVQMNN